MADPRVPLRRDLGCVVIMLYMHSIGWRATRKICQDSPEQSPPSGAALDAGYWMLSMCAIKPRLTRNLLLRVQILKVTVTKPAAHIGFNAYEHGTEGDVTHWSVPTRRPDLASPMYCIWCHHSLMPTRRILRIVRARETMAEVV